MDDMNKLSVFTDTKLSLIKKKKQNGSTKQTLQHKHSLLLLRRVMLVKYQYSDPGEKLLWSMMLGSFHESWHLFALELTSQLHKEPLSSCPEFECQNVVSHARFCGAYRSIYRSEIRRHHSHCLHISCRHPHNVWYSCNIWLTAGLMPAAAFERWWPICPTVWLWWPPIIPCAAAIILPAETDAAMLEAFCKSA